MLSAHLKCPFYKVTVPFFVPGVNTTFWGVILYSYFMPACRKVKTISLVLQGAVCDLMHYCMIVVVFVFNVPPTAKVIWRRGHGLKSHPTDW